MPSIKIISTPPGEAPLEIREAWIGIVLPLAESKIRNGSTFGVLSWPGGLFQQWWEILRGCAKNESTYAVNAKTAIEILEASKPEAAAWWRENAPQLLVPYRRFGFAPDACELLANPSPNEQTPIYQ